MGETARGEDRVYLVHFAERGGDGAMIGEGRSERVASLYREEAARVQRIVSARVSAPEAVIEDACQLAWARLCLHAEVSLEDRAVVGWLVTTAVRAAWRYARREVAVGGWLPDPDHESEVPEPAGDAPDPLAILAERDEAVRALDVLTSRERRFVALQALGFTYREIAQRLRVTERTAERQILRGRRKLREGAESC